MLQYRSTKSPQQLPTSHEEDREDDALPMPRILTAMKRQRLGLRALPRPGIAVGHFSQPEPQLPAGPIADEARTMPATAHNARPPQAGQFPSPRQSDPEAAPAIVSKPAAPAIVSKPAAPGPSPAADMEFAKTIPAQQRIKPVTLEPSIAASQTPVKSRKNWRVRPVLLAATLGTVIFIVATHGGRDTRGARPLLSQIDNLAQLAGLGINQVSLKGHRYTADGDIFDALELDKYRSMASFSITQARARLEALPWIDQANIARELPDQLVVEVSEREPFALWRARGKHQLIDASGRVLAVIKPDGADHLPLVIGAGAATRAKALLRIIARYPKIAKRLVAVERVGGRRWTLWFAGGPRADLAVHLPQKNEAEAIARLDQLNTSTSVLNRSLAAIDLRIPNQMNLTPVRSKQPGQARSGKASRPGRT